MATLCLPNLLTCHSVSAEDLLLDFLYLSALFLGHDELSPCLCVELAGRRLLLHRRINVVHE